MREVTLPGLFPDVAAGARRVFVSTVADGLVQVYAVSGATPTLVYAAPCAAQGFARLRLVQGTLYLAYRDGEGAVVTLVDVLASRVVRRHVGTFYNWPVALGEGGYAVNDHRRGVCEVFSYADRPLTGHSAESAVFQGRSGQAPLASHPALPGTGVARVTLANAPLSVDEVRSWLIGMYMPESAGGVTLGEAREDGGVRIITPDGQARTLWPGTDTFVPRVAFDTGRYAIVTSDYRTVRVALDLTPEDLMALPLYVVAPPPEPPSPSDPTPPPPPPTPVPPPVVVSPTVPTAPPPPVPPAPKPPSKWARIWAAVRPIVLAWATKKLSPKDAR